MLLSSVSANDVSQSHIDSVKIAIVRGARCEDLSDEVKSILIEKYLSNVKDVPTSLRFSEIIRAEFGCFNDHHEPYFMCPEEMTFAINYWGAYRSMMLLRQHLDMRHDLVKAYISNVWSSLSEAGVYSFSIDVYKHTLAVDRSFEVAAELLERSGIQSIKTHAFVPQVMNYNIGVNISDQFMTIID